jgi:hypothetical protein
MHGIRPAIRYGSSLFVVPSLELASKAAQRGATYYEVASMHGIRPAIHGRRSAPGVPGASPFLANESDGLGRILLGKLA